MKKVLFLAFVFPFILLCSCEQQNALDVNAVLGKAFKNRDVSQGTSTVDDYTTFFEFPHERVCRKRFFGHTYWLNADDIDDYSSGEGYYEYIIDGNQIILKDLATEEEEYTLQYSRGRLTLGSMVYTECGSVELDATLGNRLPPAGKRTYLPVGWYDSGYLEAHVKYLAEGMAMIGDEKGLQSLPEYILKENLDASAIHVVDDQTVETALPAISLARRKDYFAQQTYSTGARSFTYYFYFHMYYGSYKYRLVDGIIYVNNIRNGKWENMGTYEEGSDVIYMGAINDELVAYGNGFHKVNYNGGYDVSKK